MSKTTEEILLEKVGKLALSGLKWKSLDERKNRITEAMHEYADQQLAEFKEKLKDELATRKKKYHPEVLNDSFINGRFWEAQEIIELIDSI
jgi:hypothetical protein